MSPFVALLLVQSPDPLTLLAGDWTSLESVETPTGKKTLRLKGKNRWVFKGKLLEVHEEYSVDGDPDKGENHILLRAIDGGKIAAWWYVPTLTEPLVFDGTIEETGMTLTRKDGKMRIVYKWDGPKAYDAKLQMRRSVDDPWADRTVARYTKS